jgi:hypothetical protein
MIRILMLDLGDTLIKNDAVLPHVPEALEVLSKFETPSGATLVLSLVSDFTMPTPPSTPQKVNAIFKEYVATLTQLHLKKFFEPVERRVTLSTHAGVFKPDPLIFKKALQRLRMRLELTECMFITENAVHVAACRKLRMTALHFAPNGDFNDWSQAPLLITNLITPVSNSNKKLALQLPLETIYDLHLLSIDDSQPSRDLIHGRAQKLFPVPLELGNQQETIAIPFPVDVEISLDKQGMLRSVTYDDPDPEAVAESALFVKTLAANKQISQGGGSLKGNETHELRLDQKGRKVLQRRRYTAT